MTVTAQTLAIEIEGLGTGTSNGLPLRLTGTELRTHASVAQYVPLLTSWPGTLSNSVDPLGGTTTQGTVTFSFLADAPASIYGDKVREFFLVTRPEPAALLYADITAASGTMSVVQIPGADSIASTDTLYHEREAYYVIGVSIGGGVDSSDLITIQRGEYGTTAKAHASGAKDDREIYIGSTDGASGNPIVESRKVTLYRYTPGGSASAFWTGFVDRVEEAGGIITVTARDLWSWVAGSKLGVGAPIGTGAIFYIASDPNQRRVGAADTGGIDFTGPPLLSSGKYLVLSDGEAITPAEVSSETVDGVTRYFLDTYGTNTEAGYELLYRTAASNRIGAEPIIGDAVLREVLVSYSDNTFSHFADSSGNHSSHPFDIIRNILCSTGEALWTSGGSRTVGSNGDYDWLPSYWGLAIDDDLIDHTGIDALKALPPYAGLRMESLIVGMEGPEDAQEVLERIFQATGTFPAMSSDGKITIKDLRDPGTSGADATLTVNNIVNPGGGQSPIRWRRSGFPLVRNMIVNIGRLGDDDKPVLQLQQSDFQDRQTKRYPQIAEDVIIDAIDYGTPDGAAPLEQADIKAIFRWRWQLQTAPLPEYELEVICSVASLPAGSIVDVTAPGVMDIDGTRGITSHRCVVLDSQLNTETFSQRLRMLDLYPVTRADKLLAPAWEVASVVDAGEFSIQGSRFSADDTAFTILTTEELHLYDSSGVLRSTLATGTVNTLTTTTVSMDQPFEDGGGNVTPNVGDIIVLAAYDLGADAVEDAYAFIADSDGTLGAASNPADRWGF